MLTAASRISEPSTPLEKYSALLWPYGWSSSAGWVAMVNIARAMMPPTRLTTDSIASESRPTDPVRRQATSFNPMVTTAAEMESHVKRVSDERSVSEVMPVEC
jgi:hypothetical protein